MSDVQANLLKLRSLLNVKDEDGHVLRCSMSDGQVRLRLRGTARIRNIGRIIEAGGVVVYEKRHKGTNTFRTGGPQLGVNGTVVRRLADFDGLICAHTDEGTFYISAKKAVEHGKETQPDGNRGWKHFEGFERQILVPLDKWLKETGA